MRAKEALVDMDAPCICGPYLNCLTHKGVTLRAAGRAGGGAEPVAVLVFAPAGLEVGCTLV